MRLSSQTHRRSCCYASLHLFNYRTKKILQKLKTGENLQQLSYGHIRLTVFSCSCKSIFLFFFFKHCNEVHFTCIITCGMTMWTWPQQKRDQVSRRGDAGRSCVVCVKHPFFPHLTLLHTVNFNNHFVRLIWAKHKYLYTFVECHSESAFHACRCCVCVFISSICKHTKYIWHLFKRQRHANCLNIFLCPQNCFKCTTHTVNVYELNVPDLGGV